MKRLLICAAALAVTISAHAQPAPDQAGPAPQTDHRHVITDPDWVRVPSGLELSQYYPAARENGFVRMECDVAVDGRVTGCVVATESPPGKGFGKAALKMANLFRMKPQTRDGMPVGGAVVTIPLRFSMGVAVTPPSWITPPTPEEMLSVWPAGAPDSGGIAKIDCWVTDKGKAQQCSVLSETPNHSGFADAAVRLAPSFRLRPPTFIDKRPIGADAQLTIAFVKPQPKQNGAEKFGEITELLNAPWEAAPTTAEMAAAWPGGAPAALDEARVRVQCAFSPDASLTGCRLLSEDPAKLGFGAAALQLTDRFRTRGAFMDDAQLAKARIVVSFDFRNPRHAEPGSVWLTQPNWVSFIPEDRMTALYPSAAADTGIKTGRGVVTCTVAPNGSLTDCALESEDPEGKGFGQSALAAITYFAVNPWTEGGRPVDGLKIRVPIRFNESDPQPPPASGDAKPSTAPPAKASP